MKRQKEISIMLAFSLLLGGICHPTGKQEGDWTLTPDRELVQAEELDWGKVKDYVEDTSEASIEEDFELFEGASGYIDVDYSMPDLYFTPEEDGAYLLMLMAKSEGTSAIVTLFDVYELENENWKRIDSFYGAGMGEDDEGKTYLWRRIPQYYEKGKKYRIRFNQQYYVGSSSYRYHFTFTKTNLAGCQDGMYWRISEDDDISSYFLESERIKITRYKGNTQILEVPSRIEEHPVYAVDYDNLWENTALQVVIFHEKVQYIHSFFGGSASLKDIYIYNKDCVLLHSTETNEWKDWTIYSYSGGKVEKLCAEMGWRFVSLGKDLAETEETEQPSVTDIPVTQSPTLTPENIPDISNTSTPVPMPSATISVTEKPSSTPSATISVTVKPSSTPSATAHVTAKPTAALSVTALPTDTATSGPEASAALIVNEQERNVDGYEEMSSVAIKDFQVQADYTSVSLSWGNISGLSEYWIYRSKQKKTSYQLIKKVKGKSSYTDHNVVSGKKYYYQIKAVGRSTGSANIMGQSDVRKIQVRFFSRPKVHIQKGRMGAKRYLIIRVKKYQGKKLEIYYKKEKGKYSKLIVQSADIKKQKGCFRIRYLSSNKNLFFKMRTYSKIDKRKVYSRFTKEMKVKV